MKNKFLLFSFTVLILLSLEHNCFALIPAQKAGTDVKYQKKEPLYLSKTGKRSDYKKSADNKQESSLKLHQLKLDSLQLKGGDDFGKNTKFNSATTSGASQEQHKSTYNKTKDKGQNSPLSLHQLEFNSLKLKGRDDFGKNTKLNSASTSTPIQTQQNSTYNKTKEKEQSSALDLHQMEFNSLDLKNGLNTSPDANKREDNNTNNQSQNSSLNLHKMEFDSLDLKGGDDFGK